MEEALLRWKERPSPLPWPWDPTISEIELYVDQTRLRPKGLIAPPNLFDWSGNEQRLASRRAEESINVWGPHLFPLVERAEVRLKGIRPLQPPGIRPRADYYETVGRVDVLGSVSLAAAPRQNEIVKALVDEIGDLQKLGDSFEVLVDYKGMRRPPTNSAERRQYEWQLRTYAWLRRAQPDALPTAAGVLLFLNELAPSKEDIEALKREIRDGTTDIKASGKDLALLKKWKKSMGPPDFSEELRRRRSILIVRVDEPLVEQSLREFDKVVWQIETAVSREMAGIGIADAWSRTYLDSGNAPPEERYCTACDFKSYCPILERRKRRKNPEAP